MIMKDYTERVEKISKLLQDRTSVFPVRDSSFDRLNDELIVFAKDLLAEVDYDEYIYHEEIIEKAGYLADSPVFICGSMKSGTTLLSHLLDFHPDILVMPGDSYYYNKYSKGIREDFNDIASYWVHRVVNPTGQEPFWFFGSEEKVLKTFLAYLNYFIKTTNNNTFICVVKSFYVMNAIFLKRFPQKYWVEKTPHNELNAQELSRLFPKAKFIHVLRDPLDNIASLKRLDDFRDWKWSALSHAKMIKKLLVSARRNQEILGSEKYLVIKYEDLTANLSSVMKIVSEFLKIPFDPILLIPTENGSPAVANSMFQGDRVKGVVLNRKKTQRYKNMTIEELQDIVTTLHVEVVRAGYDWNSMDVLKYKQRGAAYLLHFLKRFFKRAFLYFYQVMSIGGNN